MEFKCFSCGKNFSQSHLNALYRIKYNLLVSDFDENVLRENPRICCRMRLMHLVDLYGTNQIEQPEI